MRTAVVTGASSGIGEAICKKLVSEGIRVYGIGRAFEGVEKQELLIPVRIDLTKIPAVVAEIQRLRKKEEISILVNNAGVGYFGLHEELNPAKIHEMTAVNVEAPLVITQLLLRDLKKYQGHIINISSVTAKNKNPHGCAYGATKAALTGFSLSLFEEVRKYGVKVTAIHPDMTQSRFYRNADFHEGKEEDTFLYPEEIAEAVFGILNSREGMCVPELVLTPQKHRIERK